VRRLGKGGKDGVTRTRFANLKEEVVLLGNDVLEVSFLPSCGGQILEIFDKRTRRNQVALNYADLPNLKSIMFAHGVWDSFWFTMPDLPSFGYGRRTTLVAAEGKDGSVSFTFQEKGVTCEKRLTLKGETLTMSVTAKNTTDRVLKANWHLHPEYVPGGSADSYSDYLLVPLKTGAYKLVFWSGLGERQMEPLTEGWWRMVDPAAKYEIRQDFDHTRFQNVKTWFGIGTWNVELVTKALELPANGQTAFSVTWRFSPMQ